MSFYEKVKKLCDKKGIAVTKFALDLGLSDAAATYWKKTGAAPKASTVKAAADYFGVPVEYFTDENYGKVTAEAPASAPEMDDVLMFALLGGTDEKARAMWEKVKEYAEFLKATDK